MSRCVRDLKEMICLSRINEKPNEPFCKSNTFIENEVFNKLNSHSTTCSWIDLEQFLLGISENTQTEWLEETNKYLLSLSKLFDDENFYFHFCNFWIELFPDFRKTEILKMEMEIVCSCINNSSSLMDYLFSYIFWEYPTSLLSDKYLFLQYLKVLSSKTDKKFKTLLSSISIPSKSPEVLQCCLTLRAFCMASIWNAVGLFYKSLVDRSDIPFRLIPTNEWKNHSDEFESQTNLILKLDFKSILEYWESKNQLNLTNYKDKNDRHLLLKAVSFHSENIIKYLLNRPDTNSLVNVPSDTGNTPLHLSVCQDNLEIIRLIVENDKTNINAVNHQSDCFSPLHMAVMYGNLEAVKCLLEHGADLNQSTESGSSIYDLAKAYQQTPVIEFLNSVTNQDIS